MDLLERLRRAIGIGAAISVTAVGCADGDAPIDANAYPLDALACSGPTYDNGYYGQCCVAVQCYSASVCLPGNDPGLRQHIYVPPGSGECGCTNAEGYGHLDGPFGPNEADADAPEGNCCYLVGAIVCEGRPLNVEGANEGAACHSDTGAVRAAPVARRP